MPRSLGYCLAQATPEDGLAEQKRAITVFLAKTAGTVPGGCEPAWYADPFVECVHSLSLRPAGRRLLADAQPGDAIVVAQLHLLAKDVRDLKTTISLCARGRVALWSCEHGLDLASGAGTAFLAILEVAERMRWVQASAQTRRVNQKRAAAGLASLRPLAYGFKYQWERRKGVRVKVEVPDPTERELMKRLLAWREQGMSYEAMVARLNADDGGCPNINKLTGRPSRSPWYKSKIKRLIQAETRLQQREQAERVEPGPVRRRDLGPTYEAPPTPKRLMQPTIPQGSSARAPRPLGGP